MNARVLAAGAIAILFVLPVAHARDDRLRFPLADVLNSANARTKLSTGIRLYFGTQKFPAPKREMGTFTANKKTNFFNKSDKEGCEWAFLSAAISLQGRASQLGGNAVVNIKSVYKNVEFISETEYECGAGGVIGGVALRGDVVALP